MTNSRQIIISETEFIKFVHDEEKNQDVILVETSEDPSVFKHFKSIDIFDSFLYGKRYILLALRIPSDDMTPLYDLIVSNFKGNLLDALNNIKKIFESESSADDYLKFRGDYAEALFMYKNHGAIKLPETETADIEYESIMYEIKSYSPSKQSVIISLKQIIENSTKLALPLLIDSNGKTILELADQIHDRIFSEYLFKTYDNTKYAFVRYKNAEFKNINKFLPILKWPENILSADFVIGINKKS